MAEPRYVSREEYEAEIADLQRRRREYNGKWDNLRRIVANIRRWERVIADLEARYGELARTGWLRLRGPERREYLQIRDTRLPRARAYWMGWDTERTSIIAEIKREREDIRTVEAAIASKVVVVIYKLTITVNNPEWGTTAPAPGSYDYVEKTTASVTAIPKEGYTLDYWQLDGVEYVPHPGDTVNILMDKNHTLTAILKKIIEELIADEECTGYDIFYDVERKKYVVRDPKTKEKIREENKICMELTASIETSEGHEVPVVVEITCTTYVKQMSLSELVKAEKAVEEGLRKWLIEQGWEALMHGFEKVGVAYNGEEHIKKAGRYTWFVHDYPRVNVLVEKKQPRERTYKGEFTVE